MAGFTNIGTILKFGGVPQALVTAIPKYPEIVTTVMDTTVLNPSPAWKTNIPSGLLDGGAFDVEIETGAAALAAIITIMTNKTIQAVELDFTTGDMLTFNGWISKLSPGGAAGANSPATEKFKITIEPTGAIAAATQSGFWYTPCDSLAVAGGDIASFVTGASPKQMYAYAMVGGSGFQFLAPNADLTWTSGTPGKCTLGANTGILTWVSAGGTSVCTVSATSKAALNDRFNVTTA
jgi:hypothetical protein